MQYLFIFTSYILAFLIIRHKGVQRTKWLIIGLLFTFLDITILVSPPISSHKLYLIAYYVSLITHKEFKSEFKLYPFKNITIALFAISFIIAFVDNRLNFASQIQRGFTNILELSSLFIGYTCIRSIRDYQFLHKKIYNYVVIIGLYGLLTWILQNNPYYDLVTSLFNSGEVGIWSEVQDRGYRVCSTFSNPIVYGFILSLYVFCFLDLKKQKIIQCKNFFLVLVISNIILSNSRTNLISFLILFISYLTLKYKFSKKLFEYIFMSILILTIAYITIPPIQNIFDSVLDIYLTGGTNTTGSTLELKDKQQEFSMIFFFQAPWFGNGYNYFLEVIQMGKINFYNGELAGLEGYGYKLLVEQGIIMIIANIIYALQIFLFLIKNRKDNNSIIALSCFLAFIFFIMVAGTYGGVMYYSFIIIGMYIKLVNNKYNINHKLKQ